MHEHRKLAEACHFRKQMTQVEHERDPFIFAVSALLTATRSVLQYAIKEASAKPGGKAWWKGRVDGSPTLTYFRQKRNANVHSEPIKAKRMIEVHITERAGIREGAITVGPGDTITAGHKSNPKARPAVVVHHYTFEDWPGPEEVPDLCDRLLAELQDVVAEGQRLGFLTP